MDIINEASMPYDVNGMAGCWILPDGEIETCDYDSDFHHADIASQHFNIDDDDEFVVAAMRNGWIRIRLTDEEFSIELSLDHAGGRAIRQMPRLVGDQIRFIVDAYKDEDHLTCSTSSIGSMLNWIRSHQ